MKAGSWSQYKWWRECPWSHHCLCGFYHPHPHGDSHVCLKDIRMLERHTLFSQGEELPLKPKGAGTKGERKLLFHSLSFGSSGSKFPVPSFSPKPPGRLLSFMPSALQESCTPSPRTVAWAILKTVAAMSQKMEKRVSCTLWCGWRSEEGRATCRLRSSRKRLRDTQVPQSPRCWQQLLGGSSWTYTLPRDELGPWI